MKESEEHDDLWQLLGQARKPAVSPLFSRNVLREIRQSKQESAGVFSWFRIASWRMAALGGLAVVLLVLNGVQFIAPQKPMAATSTIPTHVAVAQAAPATGKPDDAEVIKHLDELLAYEENTIWLDDSSK